ncbi:phosphate starvation-inducible protein PhoH [Alkalilimnicola ehrlichii]|uniref:PhoH-like protein n=1 Tax=Alkalilimnicola ehrlichii TaxID=351052 RepID=A0A3E0WXY0_9GAMM|nr:PhoH family protein [Alkalilimnicola ehrlichii]RFA30263.1 phosphate starvation-inducible protein PhoH [Alkalilimnicola ehrlichii]RFA37842.1 phosphate starvation-inducible protein PhoH [Alkalilimnicola ehrlichii]
MSEHPDSIDFTLEPADNQRLARLSGQLDENLRQLERRLGVEISNRGHRFRVIGASTAIQQAQHLLEELYQVAGKGDLSPDRVHLHLQESALEQRRQAEGEVEEVIVSTPKAQIRGRGPNQQRYLNNILDHDLNFGVGPAGTGKTYLAVACAVNALEAGDVRRLVLVRPAVEAGERLGFLPGDLAQKVDPYLRPLYDALFEMLGFERVGKLIERNVIEVAPLAYMRGRTLNHSFIILDEAQNTTVEQMKMFLTRIGFGSTVVVTGDVTQVDLPHGKRSGLRDAIEVLSDVDGVSFTFFNAQDVVRHALVQRIVTAYDRHEMESQA